MVCLKSGLQGYTESDLQYLQESFALGKCSIALMNGISFRGYGTHSLMIFVDCQQGFTKNMASTVSIHTSDVAVQQHFTTVVKMCKILSATWHFYVALQIHGQCQSLKSAVFVSCPCCSIIMLVVDVSSLRESTKHYQVSHSHAESTMLGNTHGQWVGIHPSVLQRTVP